MILETYNWSVQQFIEDLGQLWVEKLGSKYGSFIDQAAQDLQTSILRLPPITGELITFRYVENVDYLNLGSGQISRLKGFTSTSINYEFFVKSVDAFRMVFIIPAGSHVLPFIHRDSIRGEDEILLPHGTQIIHERTLKFDHDFDIVRQPQTDIYYPFWKYVRPIDDYGPAQPRQDPFTHKFQDIKCAKVKLTKEIYIFRVLSDPWEVKAALAYDPLKYNLYGACLDQVSEQTGVSIETIKRISEQHLFSR